MNFTTETLGIVVMNSNTHNDKINLLFNNTDTWKINEPIFNETQKFKRAIRKLINNKSRKEKK